MLNFYKIIALLLFSVLLLCCKISKDSLYLEDIKNQEVLNSPGSSPEYRIKTDDNLYINIQTVDATVNQLFNLSQNASVSIGVGSPSASQTINGYVVDSNGAITLSGLGEITVAGKTALEAQALIKEKASVYLKNPSIQVKILSFKITILGEVKSPGIIYNYNNSITILEALGMVGGTSENAKINQLLVVRRTPTGSKSYRLDLSDKKLFNSEAYYLQPNDLIYVNSDKMKNFRTAMPVYTFLISSVTTIMVMLQYFRY